MSQSPIYNQVPPDFHRRGRAITRASEANGGFLKNLSLGTVGNTIAGVVGGGIGGKILSAVLGSGSSGSAVGNIAGSGVGSIVLVAIAGLIKNAMAKKG